MKRSGPIKRKTPLARGNKRLSPVSPRRKLELSTYARARSQYLAEHPFCQASIIIHNLDEQEVIANGGHSPATPYHRGYDVPRSTEIHHMGKRRGAMLYDKSKFLAVCRAMHERIESNKSWARDNGLLENF